MDVGWNYRREHLRIQQRSHYVMTNGGDQPNVVPRECLDLVLLPRDDRIDHQTDVGDRRQDRARRRADDRHHGDVARARFGLAACTRTARSPRPCTRTSTGRTPDVDRRGQSRWPRPYSASLRCRRRASRPNSDELAAARPFRTRRSAAEVGRCRRHLVERADGDLRYPGQLPGRARSQLGQRDRDGDADRAQRRHRGCQGAGDDHARPAHTAGARDAGVGVLQERADEGCDIHPAPPTSGHTRHVAQRRDDGKISIRDEEVLLRPGEAQDVLGSTGHQYPTVR